MNFIATVEDNQRSNIQEIARSLEKVGVQVREVMRITGVIRGTSGSLAKVRIPGIRSVEQDRTLRAS